MAAGPTLFPDIAWGNGPAIDLDAELEAHEDGRHESRPTPNTCPAC